MSELCLPGVERSDPYELQIEANLDPGILNCKVVSTRR